MLTLGVPGSGTTAVLLAMLLTLNITPEPLLFQQQPDVVWGLIAALFLGNLMLLVMNIPLVGLFVRVLMVPSHILMPGVAMIGFVGIYSISGSVFDLFLMIGFGVIGYVLRKLDVPLVPIILGILLGNQMKDNLRRALQISNGGPWSYDALPTCRQVKSQPPPGLAGAMHSTCSGWKSCAAAGRPSAASAPPSQSAFRP